MSASRIDQGVLLSWGRKAPGSERCGGEAQAAPPVESKRRRMTRLSSRPSRLGARDLRAPHPPLAIGDSSSSIAERITPFHYTRTEWFVPCILRSMDTETTPRLPGRQSEAARNDRAILEAARAVFTADPGAPISAVAERAGVGISALYRRYRSKEELLQQLSLDGLRRYIAEVEAALADDGDPWEAFAAFMRRAVDADTSSLTLHLAGTFTPTEDHWRDGEKSAQLNTRLLNRTKDAGRPAPGDRGRRSVAAIRAVGSDQGRRSGTHQATAAALPGALARRFARYLCRAAARTAAQLGGDQPSLGG